MTSTTTSAGELRLALDDISVRENVRELDSAHVESLAQSIALRGVLVPLIVRPVDAGHELVAGYTGSLPAACWTCLTCPWWCETTRAQAPTARRRT